MTEHLETCMSGLKTTYPELTIQLKGFTVHLQRTFPTIHRYRNFQHKKGNERVHHLHGNKPPVSRKKYQKVTEKLKIQVGRLDTNILTGLPYLEQIAKVMTIPTD